MANTAIGSRIEDSIDNAHNALKKKRNTWIWVVIVVVIAAVLVMDYMSANRIVDLEPVTPLPTPEEYRTAYITIKDADEATATAVAAAEVTVERGKAIVKPNHDLRKAVNEWNKEAKYEE